MYNIIIYIIYIHNSQSESKYAFYYNLQNLQVIKNYFQISTHFKWTLLYCSDA